MEENKVVEESTEEKNKEGDYLQIESPVLLIDLLNQPQPNAESSLFNSIVETINRISILEVRNIVIKTNQLEFFKSILNNIDTTNKIHINVRIPLDNLKEFDEFVNEAKFKFSISCIVDELAKDEDLSVLDEVKTINHPLVIKCDDQNFDYIMDKLSHISVEVEAPIIIEPILNLLNEKDQVGLSWEKFDSLYCKIIDILREHPTKKLLMDYGILPTRLLTEHPCNGYVCSGQTCHSSKSKLPRRLYLKVNGDILPENINIDESYKLGNILEQDILEVFKSYKNSETHGKFLSLAKVAYTKWVQTCPYRVIPWSILLGYVSRGDM